MKRAKYSIATIQLANKLIANMTHESLEAIYATLCRAVYGNAADVDAADLVHALTEMMGKSDPSEPE